METGAVDLTPPFHTVLCSVADTGILAHVWGCVSGDNVFEIGSHCTITWSPEQKLMSYTWTGMAGIFSCSDLTGPLSSSKRVLMFQSCTLKYLCAEAGQELCSLFRLD